jgi:two-component system response regulator AtoC
MRKNIVDLMAEEGFACAEAEDGDGALYAIRKRMPSVVLLDINLPKTDGLTVLRQMRHQWPDLPVIVFTAYGTSERAIEAMKLGAFDYVEKPFDLDSFLNSIHGALKYNALLSKVKDTSHTPVLPVPASIMSPELIGTSSRMQEIFKTIGRVAATDAAILIEGESGTGKELVADAIQRHSFRNDKPFIKVNCGALLETLLESEMFGHEKGSFTGAVAQRLGRFELAHGGTIFLDEVNTMTPALQVKLLRILQHKTFERVGGRETLMSDVRIIAASNKSLVQEALDGRFREDLFYRLNVVHILVPPLREHSEDIPLLVAHFLKQFSPDTTASLSAEVLPMLSSYHWPGNTRELENAVHRAVIHARGRILTPEHFSQHVRSSVSGEKLQTDHRNGKGLKEATQEIEKDMILRALEQTHGNRSRAAQLLKINRRQLFSKMLQYRISGHRFSNTP